jgi:hypothetical protein
MRVELTENEGEKLNWVAYADKSGAERAVETGDKLYIGINNESKTLSDPISDGSYTLNYIDDVTYSMQTQQIQIIGGQVNPV